MLILTADIGSTYTKLTAIDTAREEIVATAASFTTIETDVMEGFRKALHKIEEQIPNFSYNKLLCCSSAAGGLKMVALGLVPELTAKAARLAAASAGAKVVKTYSFEISQVELDEIAAIEPDLILLSGGTDGGNKEVIVPNAKHLSRLEGNFSVIVAGNKSAAAEVGAVFDAAEVPYVIAENVMPEFNRLNIEPAQKHITELFIDQIIEAKGLNHIQQLTPHDIIPTPLAVLQACGWLSDGTANEAGIGELMVVDLGGATTDVYSISDGKPTLEDVTVKGLPEPYRKRTVEGDLGMRYSLHALADDLDMDRFADEAGISKERAETWVQAVTDNPDLLAEPHSEEQSIELAFAREAVRIAVERHAGRYEPVFTPFGQVFALTGKDLSAIPYIIGVGGAIINAPDATHILEGALGTAGDYEYAKPKNPKLKIDSSYVFAAMGLLSQVDADLAVQLMKKYIIK